MKTIAAYVAGLLTAGTIVLAALNWQDLRWNLVEFLAGGGSIVYNVEMTDNDVCIKPKHSLVSHNIIRGMAHVHTCQDIDDDRSAKGDQGI